MGRTSPSLVLAVVGLGAVLVVAARAQSDVNSIMTSERAFAKAAVDGDAEAMATYMSDDYIEFSSEQIQGGKTVWKAMTKSEWVEKVRSKREKYTSVELHNLKVYLQTTVATLTGEYSQTGTEDGKDISASGFYVDTWVKVNGKWKVVSSVFP